MTEKRLVPESADLLEVWRDEEDDIGLLEMLACVPVDCREGANLRLVAQDSGMARLSVQWDRLETDFEMRQRIGGAKDRQERKAMTDAITAASVERREREQLAALQRKYGTTPPWRRTVGSENRD